MTRSTLVLHVSKSQRHILIMSHHTCVLVCFSICLCCSQINPRRPDTCDQSPTCTVCQQCKNIKYGCFLFKIVLTNQLCHHLHKTFSQIVMLNNIRSVTDYILSMWLIYVCHGMCAYVGTKFLVFWTLKRDKSAKKGLSLLFTNKLPCFLWELLLPGL